MLEGLERRFLLAANVSLVKGQLNVIGTSGADDIEISQSGGVTTVNDGGVITTLTRAVSHVVLQGKAGNDRLVVQDSVLVDSNIDGGDGNDFLRGGVGPDRVAGGKGIDTISYANRISAVTVDLDGMADDGSAGENDTIRADIENIEGGEGNDRLTGSSSANVISGLGGDDLLRGLQGNDDFVGGTGFDTVDYSGPVFVFRLFVSVDDVANDGLRLGSFQEAD